MSPHSHTQTPVIQEEDPERYSVGGYHPVQLGDIFNERYTVLRKLGFGMYATIWLAHDQRTSEFVVVKVLVAKQINGLDERTFLDKIAHECAEPCPHIVRHLDTFEHRGPHGTHTCLVFEVLAQSLWDFRRVERSLGRPSELPSFAIKRVARQLLIALKHLHGLGIIHTDLKSSNVLFTIPDTKTFIQSWLEDTPAIGQRRKEDSYQPLQSQPLFIRPSKAFSIKLIDLGSAQMIGRAPDLFPIQPEALRAPEVILRAKWDSAADIWNFACMIYELYSGYLLFDISEGPTYSRTDLHLALMQSLRGKFPSQLLAAGEYSDKYFSKEDGTVSRVTVEPVDFKEILSDWLSDKHDATPQEIGDFYDFMSSALQLNPADRPSAEELLKHSWLSSQGD